MLPEPDYDVGYRKPPKHTRFKKGQSGNPRGRPRGSKNHATLLNEALDEKVTVTEHGQRRQITKRQAMYKQLANRAAQGEYRFTQTVLRQIEGQKQCTGVCGASCGDTPEQPISAVVVLPHNDRDPLDPELLEAYARVKHEYDMRKKRRRRQDPPEPDYLH